MPWSITTTTKSKSADGANRDHYFDTYRLLATKKMAWMSETI
jgi:hypothetical protein